MNILSSEFFIILGLDTKDKNLFDGNAVGLIVNLVYATIFINYLNISELYKCLTDLIMYCSVVMLFFSFYVFYNDNNIVRNIAMIFSFMSVFTPGEKIMQVYETRNRNYISAAINMSQILKCAVSIVYELNREVLPPDNPNYIPGKRFPVYIDITGIVVSISLLISWLMLGSPNIINTVNTESDDEEKGQILGKESQNAIGKNNSNVRIIETNGDSHSVASQLESPEKDIQVGPKTKKVSYVSLLTAPIHQQPENSSIPPVPKPFLLKLKTMDPKPDTHLSKDTNNVQKERPMKTWIKRKMREVKEKNIREGQKRSITGQVNNAIAKNFAFSGDLHSSFFKNFVQDRLKLEISIRNTNLNKNNIEERVGTEESWSD